jgi:Domain of unknown function (DUF1338)
MAVSTMFEKMWKDYTDLNPSVLNVHKVFTDRRETVVNDHVAFRTYNDPRIGLKQYSQFFLKNGYTKKGEYSFKVKKLYAEHFEHADSKMPKIFISELLTEQLSESAQSIIRKLIAQMDFKKVQNDDFCISGRAWSVSYQDYQTLLNESEYAAWMSAFGFRVNHFTVLVNELKTFQSLNEVNTALKTAGIPLNTAGGEIKGSEAIGLAQSSTLASPVSVAFTDGTYKIPGCYYEFAHRFPVNGVLYSGFVEQSADKIFESTNVRK